MNVLKKLLHSWMSFARFIGRVNTAVLLTLFFLFVITPFGVVLRSLGKNCLRTPERGSLWTERAEAEDLERPF